MLTRKRIHGSQCVNGWRQLYIIIFSLYPDPRSRRTIYNMVSNLHTYLCMHAAWSAPGNGVWHCSRPIYGGLSTVARVRCLPCLPCLWACVYVMCVCVLVLICLAARHAWVMYLEVICTGSRELMRERRSPGQEIAALCGKRVPRHIPGALRPEARDRHGVTPDAKTVRSPLPDRVGPPQWRMLVLPLSILLQPETSDRKRRDTSVLLRFILPLPAF